jgi:hypothetical protein
MEGDCSMSTPARKLALASSIVLVLAGVAAWPVSRASLDHLVIEPEVTRWEVSPPDTVQVTQASRPRSLPPSAAASTAKPSMADRHPHPFTAEREALQQELRLVGALQDALDLEDVPALRDLIDRYRAHVPADENKLAEGYARLADCLEVDHDQHDSVRAAALAYYDNERASTLRRYIRRICLER